MRRFVMRVLSLFLAFLVTPALAEAVRDEATGLAVDPPPGYTARALPAQGQFAAIFEVKKPEDQDTGCRVAFQNAPENEALTQEQINAQTGKDEWNTLVRDTIGNIYDIRHLDVFEHSGVKGTAIIGDIKPQPGVPERANQVRTLLVILETPRGRTSTVCVDEKTDFATRRAEFEQVARATTLPK